MGSEETVLSGKRPSGAKAQISLAEATKYWPTPAASVNGSGRMNKSQSAGAAERPTLGLMASKGLWPSVRATDGEKGGPNQRGSKGDLMLPSAVQVSSEWRTPNAYDAHQRHNKVGTERRLAIGKTISLGMQMSVETGKCSSLLNPAWVSQLQALPDGWLDESLPALDADARRRAVLTPRWPAPPGQSQHDFEAPRTCAGQKGRIKQLEALGNLCPAAQSYPIFAAIMEMEADHGR